MGSLMWRPGFDFAERAAATLHGRHRAFCIYSVHHRGTHERKGLVLGLTPGGAARGIAYRVDDDRWQETYSYLKEREQPTETYVEAIVDVRLADGRRISALTYISDRQHSQWAGDIPLETQARLIAVATGLSGRNVDYLRDLVSHLRAEGIRDREMERLLVMTEALESSSAHHAREIE